MHPPRPNNSATLRPANNPIPLRRATTSRAVLQAPSSVHTSPARSTKSSPLVSSQSRLPAAGSSTSASPDNSSEEDSVMLWNHIHVTFGPGLRVLKIHIDSQSRHVTAHFVPTSANERKLFEPYGEIKAIKSEIRGTNKVVSVEYKDKESASVAIARLQGTSIQGSIIWVKRPTGARAARGGVRRTKVELTWMLPTGANAENLASELKVSSNGLAAVFERAVQEAVDDISPAERFVAQKTNVPEKWTALATYSTDENARRAVSILDERWLETMGNCVIRAKLVTNLCISIDRETYKVVGPEISKLRKKYAIEPMDQSPKINRPSTGWAQMKLGCQKDHAIQTTPTPSSPGHKKSQPFNPLRLTIETNDVELATNIKADLDKILAGDMIVRGPDGVGLDNALFKPKAVPTLKIIESQTRACIRVDTNRRILRIYGAPLARSHAKKKIFAYQARLRQEGVSIKLPSPLLRSLIAADKNLEKLKADSLADEISIELVLSAIVVRGHDEAVRNVRRALWTFRSEFSAGNTEEQSCSVCLCDIAVSGAIQLTACGHWYCRECFDHHLESAAQHLPFACAGCGEPVSLRDLRPRLDATKMDTIRKAALQSYLATAAEKYRPCVGVDCPQVYEADKGEWTCPECAQDVCTTCHIEFHYGLTCRQYKARNGDQDAMWREYFETYGVKHCPKCSSPIEKNGGCNSLFCFSCKAVFCWKCSKTFANTTLCHEHLNRAHGGYYT